MDKTTERQEEVFAHVVFSGLNGRQPVSGELDVARQYWNREFTSPWSDPDDRDTAGYTARFFASLKEIRDQTSLVERWREQFDAAYYPLPGRAQRFLSDFMHTMLHYPRHYHQFSCHRQCIQPGHIMDFPIEHPLAVDYWTIYISNDGRGLLETGDQKLVVQPCSALIMPPGQRGIVCRDPGSPHWDYDMLSFRSIPRWLELLDWTFSLSTPALIHFAESSHWSQLQDVIDQLEHTTYRIGHYSEQLCHNLIENLLIRFRLSREAEVGSELLDERLISVMNYLLVHYQDGLQLEEIARRVRLSPGRLNALFRDQFGSSVMKWRDALRLQKARELLTFTQLPINEIAEQVGYEDPLYFSRRFKQQFGESPRAMRRAS